MSLIQINNLKEHTNRPLANTFHAQKGKITFWGRDMYYIHSVALKNFKKYYRIDNI